MASYILDIETNGLLGSLDRVHCVALKDIETGEVYSYADQQGHKPICDALERMATADMLVAHNGIGFDLPALKKVYGWSPTDRGTPGPIIRDTLTISRLIWTDLKDRDMRRRKKKQPDFPGNLTGSHSLKAWGLRLGNHKGDYTGGWDAWSQEMHDYMVQDTEVTLELWKLIQSCQYSEEAIQLEHDVAAILFKQEQRGFAFNEVGAAELYATLIEDRTKLADELAKVFGGWWAPNGRKTPARSINYKDPTKASRVEGCEFTDVKWTEFNPASRAHIGQRLIALHGWKPSEYGKDGKPKVDEETLSQLKYPEAKLLTRYLTIEKRIGQLSTGRQAWLKKSVDGVIYGRVNTNGAVTGRMTHSNPNLAQVPASRSIYGHECRSLFRARPGYKLVGIDADALELRCLAGYMARWDKGAYIKTVLEGDKSKGTDIHSTNAHAIGLDPKKDYTFNGKPGSGRDHVKTWFYAYIYGAGNFKLGQILGGKNRAACTRLGKKSRGEFEKNLPALGKLADAVKAKAKSRGYLRGLDGRMLVVRSEHAALNTLLQSAGAIFMKKALVVFEDELRGHDAYFIANVHDEWQVEVRPDCGDVIGKMGVSALVLAGEHFNFRCPLDGNFEIGETWADTH